MGFLNSLFTWMVSAAPPGDLALIAGLAFLWTLITLVAVKADDVSDTPLPGLVVLGGIAGLAAGIVGALNGAWAQIVAGVMGLSVIPGIIGVVEGIGWLRGRWKALKAWSAQQDRLEAEARKRLAAETKARAEAAEREPKNVLKRCEAVVAAVKKAIPLTVTAPEQLAEAESKLDALRSLYVLEAQMAALSDGLPPLEERLAAADALFADVSLEKQAPELLAKLREGNATAKERREAVRSAIEEMVAVIMTLPDRMNTELTLDPPMAYQTAAADVADDLNVRLTQLAPPDEESPRPARKAELA